MSENRELLRTTNMKDLAAAQVGGGDPVEAYPRIIAEIRSRCGDDVASLFAEPVRPMNPDVSNPEITWYTPLPGQMFDLNEMDDVAKRPVLSLLRSRLQKLAPVLADPEIGAIVASWLYIPSSRDLLSVGAAPVLINWGHVSSAVAASSVARETHFADTIGRHAPGLLLPPFTPVEAISYTERLRNSRSGDQGSKVAAGSATATATAALIAQPDATDERRSLVPPLVAVGVGLVVLIFLLWPRVLIYPDRNAEQLLADKQAQLLKADNDGLEARARELEDAAKDKVCRLPNGEVAPLSLPGQPPPASLKPRTDLLPPSPNRVQTAVGPGAPNDKTMLNSILDNAAVLVLVNSADGGYSMGSGFFVSPDRIVTNRHVVDTPGGLLVTNKAMRQAVSARVVAKTAPASEAGGGPDLALLAVDQPGPGVLKLGPSPSKATQVIASGYPGYLVENDSGFVALRGGDRTAAPDSVIQQGIIVQRRAEGGVAYLTHSANLGHGNSGGPLVDLCGRVVGVNTAVLNEGELATTANFAQDVTGLQQFLQANGVTPQIDEAQSQCPPAQIQASAAPSPAPPVNSRR